MTAAVVHRPSKPRRDRGDNTEVSPRLSAEVAELLAEQANVVATWQVDPNTARALQRARRQGEWRRITPRTFASGPGDPTITQRLWAAALHCGKTAQLAGQAALVTFGWKGELNWPVDVLVGPATSQRKTPSWIHMHRTRRLPTRAPGGPPRCCTARAALDAASWAVTNREAMFIVVSCLQSRLVKPEDLQQSLGAGRRNRRELIIDAVASFTDGATSMPEIEFSRLCTQYDLPAPRRQTRRTDSRGKPRYTDAEFRTASGRILIVEIDGGHPAEIAQKASDQKRQNRLVLRSDSLFLRVDSWVLKYEPDEFMPDLATGLLL
jgi:hypothetical protein